jgi:hypothetical protein
MIGGNMDPRSIADAFPWLVERLREIVSEIENGYPGLARVKAEEMIARLEGRRS